MRVYTVDCTEIAGPRDFHETIAREMNFPEWYGSNLDALHDLLAAITEETELRLLHFGILPPFARGFRRVMEDAAEENPQFQAVFL